MTTERKSWVLALQGLLALGGVLGAGAAVSAVYGEMVRGAFRLTAAAQDKIVEYFRGAEAVLQDKMREAQARVEDLEQRLARAKDELRGLEDHLADVRKATADVASEQTYDGRFEDPDGGYLKAAGAHGLYK